VVVATKAGAALRHASEEALGAGDALTVESCRPIFESSGAMLGEGCY